MLIRGDCLRRSTAWQSSKHHIDVNETVAIAVKQHDGGFNVASRVLHGFIKTLAIDNAERGVDLIIVELKTSVANNLEPVYDGLCACERVEVEIGGKLLRTGNVATAPVEQGRQRSVDDANIYRRVKDSLPHRRRGKNASSAE